MTSSLYNTFTRGKSKLMFATCVAFTAGIIALLGLVTFYLISIGISSLTWDFFTSLPSGDPKNPGGMKHAIAGTLCLIALASLAGIPLGMLTGIYLAEYSTERLVAPVRFIADVLTGVPSIVVGILGYQLLVVPISHHYNGWAGAMALAFIMVPIVARTTEEMLRLVPNSYREASIALGATKARTILRVVIPSATGSIVTGIMLAVARVAGETAPLLFTALGSRFMPFAVEGGIPKIKFSEPFPSLTKQIYDYATGPYPEQKRLAWAGILVLIAIIFVLNLMIRYFARAPRVAS
jgi:phosphate transport system permease protein